MIDMEYYVFIQNKEEKEKLVASSPSLEIARKTAERMANTTRVPGVISALLCLQENEGGEIEEVEVYHRGQKAPEILKEV